MRVKLILSSWNVDSSILQAPTHICQAPYPFLTLKSHIQATLLRPHLQSLSEALLLKAALSVFPQWRIACSWLLSNSCCVILLEVGVALRFWSLFGGVDHHHKSLFIRNSFYWGFLFCFLFSLVFFCFCPYASLPNVTPHLLLLPVKPT